MNTKNISIVVVSGLALVGISFYGGMKYQESKIPNFQNFSAQERQQMFQSGGTGANSARGFRNSDGSVGSGANIPRTGAGMNVASGEVISKDDKSITVKLRDGGSKIVFFSDKTTVSKTAEGAQNDVVVGEQVIVSGVANSDGSVIAALIQLRPSLEPAPSGSFTPTGK